MFQAIKLENIENSVESTVNKMVDLGTLLTLIPTFDTTYPEQIYRFVRSGDAAFGLASEDKKPILLVYALNKIVGTGAPDVHSRQFETWDTLKSYLISKFSNVKTVSHLMLELQSLFQKPNECLTDFYHRVDLCRSKIIEKLTAEITDSSLQGRKDTAEETALSVFINGLNSDIGTMLRTKEFKDLSTAGKFAMQEDKIRAMNNARQSLYKVQTNFKPTHNNGIRYQPRPAITYQKTPQPVQNQTKICSYCKNPGHHISECRKRAYNNNLYNKNNPNRRALPAPPAQVSNLNSEATVEVSDSSEIASSSLTDEEVAQRLGVDVESLQLQW